MNERILMAQIELEQVVRRPRDIRLHAPWSYLLTFADNVVRNLVDTCRIVVGRYSSANVVLSPALDSVYSTLQEKPYKAIASLTNEEMVVKWRSEACGKDLEKTMVSE